MAGFTGPRRVRKDVTLSVFHLRTIPEGSIQLLERPLPLIKAISELRVVATVPYHRERVSEDVAKTHLLLPVFLTAENPFKRGSERRIEINARRDFSVC
jgi:hypothetical protein